MHFYFLHTNEPSIIMTNELNPGHLTVFPNLPFWHNHSWPVTYGQREVLVLWRHIRELFLHALINWRKVDLHQCITTTNIDFPGPPSDIHGLACKKIK